MGVKIRRANADDIPALVDIGAMFFMESNFRELTYSPEQMAYSMGYMIATDDGHIFVATDGDEIIGFIAFDTAQHYTVEKVAHLFLFYALPEYRKSGVGRALLEIAEITAKMHGAKRFYCGSSAGFSDDGKTDKRLLNLYKRLGFEELGCFVMKGL